MSLLEALRSRRRIRTRDIWETAELDAAAIAVQTAFPGYEKTASLSLDQIISRLERGVESWDWADIKIGDVALAIRGVLSRQVRVSRRVSEFVQRELSATTNTVFLQAVCELYLEFWDRGASLTEGLARIIQNRGLHLPPNWKRCFAALPELLEPAAAPELLAQRMVSQNDAYQWLVANGIATPHSGQLMRFSQLAWLDALPDPRSAEQIQGVLYWMFPPGRPPLKGEPAARCIEKLLQPWQKTKPDSETQTTLLGSLIETYGDPRNQRAEFWALVSVQHRNVLIRWLAGQSMDALLSIITRSTANHMWPPRHAFWKGLYDRGLIDEAWIALSPAALADAGAMFQKTGDTIFTMTSKQVAKSRKDTCLLIMRIGRFTVVEGSHDYRLHVFLSGDPAAPEFYQDEYDAEKLTMAMGHHNTRIHDAYGQWMKWAEQRLLR
ncbi:EH signature domain-containing protein [Rhizobium beringeri]|uniref:EH signature domain-containing protein n=1 Tax=Rhizobium beringeri TaxID=3019934 RepID=UPI003B598125